MAIYVRSKNMAFTLNFPMETLEEVTNSMHLMMARGDILKFSIADGTTELINFANLGHVSISPISREEILKDETPPTKGSIEVVASLGHDGGLSIGDQAAEYLKNQEDPE